MFGVVGLDHVVLRTRNLDEMIAFYRDVLGCPIDRVSTALAGLVHLRAGSALIDLLDISSREGDEAPVNGGTNMDHLCLQVEGYSEQQMLEHFDSHGISHDGFADRYGAKGSGRTIYIKDPDGNGVELRIL